MKKVLYEELLPEECVQRIQEMPVAYLPLGTLEWHGPHMPLGADGIQSKELFVRVAEKVGGVVLPMLFMGPDRVFNDQGKSFYGMDINTEGALKTYCVQQMKGSAYWMEKELFQNYIKYLRKRPKFQNHPFLEPSSELLSSTSIRTYCRSIKVFANFCKDNDYGHDFTYKVKLPNDDAGEIIPLYQSEVQQIDKLFNLKTEFGLRNWPAVSSCYACYLSSV